MNRILYVPAQLIPSLTLLLISPTCSWMLIAQPLSLQLLLEGLHQGHESSHAPLPPTCWLVTSWCPDAATAPPILIYNTCNTATETKLSAWLVLVKRGRKAWRGVRQIALHRTSVMSSCGENWTNDRRWLGAYCGGEMGQVWASAWDILLWEIWHNRRLACNQLM